jgi:4,5-DOPA dioxygenase extradiol
MQQTIADCLLFKVEQFLHISHMPSANTFSPYAAQPSLFVPHGAPTLALHPGAAGAALARAGAGLARPRAVIIVSAHWQTEVPTVGSAARPHTIYDFWGFPGELNLIRYPATGCAEASAEVVAALRGAGFLAASDSARGLDHGAWIPLRLMFPDAEVPVVPLSIQVGRGPGHHLAVGRALAPLAARGFLVLGSGNLTHNLGDFQGLHRDAGPIPPYVREFADWIWQRIEAADVPSLLDYRRLAPDAVRAHPQEDHLLPLYVALGAAAGRSAPERVHAGVDNYVLAMDAFAFH